ncbi:MAG: ECF transporter S component [Actinomyces urogenitalis]|uniref:Uncharacterized protein n=2 Tax=Actinomyces urogenitalis TaxID=103621 RepID=C0W301_9ACTO|nr:ECF transporter S component [Actinomyces urogenitalis]EEH66879.1 hypothetical protein HMPREF0058_0245 [Actinomyces urogenitalis DSM 15434]MBS5976303.1 ECF transporter S component [Actinomyces urogenitalis]MBS6073156.1 ECF transporter S component [Actinomyces urogenitalis]MDK8237635.1 ECF transporter S component [Actinomyces urogenitalis]MDK8834840.1 ECF transporter S component [Actinomyces urogenitalis]
MTKTLPTTDTATVKGSSRSRLNNSVLGTRNLMTVAALAVVGSLIVVPLTYMTFAIGITTQRGMLIMCSCMGLWTIPYLLPAVIVRRPGACVLAGLIMGIICAFTSPQGPASIVGNVLGAVFIEAPLALMLYRKWTWWSFTLSSFVFGLLNGCMTAFAMQGVENGPVLIVVAVCSALVGGALCMVIGRAALKAGVGQKDNA